MDNTSLSSKRSVKNKPAELCRCRHIFGGAKDFCSNLRTLPEKFSCDFSLQIFSHEDHEDLFLVWPPNKCSLVMENRNRWAPDSRHKTFEGPLASQPPTPLHLSKTISLVDVGTKTTFGDHSVAKKHSAYSLKLLPISMFPPYGMGPFGARLFWRWCLSAWLLLRTCRCMFFHHPVIWNS